MGEWATLVVDTHCLLERIARLAFTRKHAVCGFILARFNISTPLIQRRRLPVSVRARGRGIAVIAFVSARRIE